MQQRKCGGARLYDGTTAARSDSDSSGASAAAVVRRAWLLVQQLRGARTRGGVRATTISVLEGGSGLTRRPTPPAAAAAAAVANVQGCQLRQQQQRRLPTPRPCHQPHPHTSKAAGPPLAPKRCWCTYSTGDSSTLPSSNTLLHMMSQFPPRNASSGALACVTPVACVRPHTQMGGVTVPLPGRSVRAPCPIQCPIQTFSVTHHRIDAFLVAPSSHFTLPTAGVTTPVHTATEARTTVAVAAAAVRLQAAWRRAPVTRVGVREMVARARAVQAAMWVCVHHFLSPRSRRQAGRANRQRRQPRQRGGCSVGGHVRPRTHSAVVSIL